MTESDPIIVGELPNDNILRQVMMLGRIYRQSGSVAEHQCEVILGQLIANDHHQNRFDGATPPLMIRVGVGTLPAMRIGHRFLGQQLINSKSEWFRTESAILNTAENSNIGTWEFGIPIEIPEWDNSKPPVPIYPAGTIGAQSLIFGLKPVSDGPMVYVPAHEMFRYFWGSTTSSYKRALDGLFGTSSEDPVFFPSECRWLSDEESAFWIEAHRYLTPGEIDAALRYCLNNQMLSWLRLIQQQMTNHHAKLEPYTPGGPFPHFSNCQWNYQYTYIAVKSNSDSGYRRRKLVTRILSLQHDLGVKKVYFGFPDGSMVTKHSAEITDFQNRPIRISNNAPAIQANHEPSKSIAKHYYSFDDGPNPLYTVTPQPRMKSSGSKPILRIPIPTDSLTIGSTAAAGSRNSDIVPVELRDRVRRQRSVAADVDHQDDENFQTLKHNTPDRLKALNDALDHLRLDRDCIIETLPTNTDTEYWNFPTHNGQKRTPFSYIDPGAWKRVRRALIVRVVYDRHVFYLFESECRKNDRQSLGILRPNPGEIVTSGYIELLLRHVADLRGVWANLPVDLYNFYRLKHIDEWTADQFARKIKARISKLVSDEL